jgi:hypothetical protein
MFSIPLDTARIYLLQGRRAEAVAQCQEALRIDEDWAETRELLAQAQEPAPPVAPLQAWTPSDDLRRRLKEKMDELSSEEHVRRQLRESISDDTRRLQKDQRYGQALEMAQAVVGNDNTLAKWALLGEAAAVLDSLAHLSDQVMEMRWIEYDLPEAITDESDRLLQPQQVGSTTQMEAAGEHLLEAAQLAETSHRQALEAMARTAASARRLSLQVVPVLAELLATGDDRPLGRLDVDRGGVMQTQLSIAQVGLSEAQEETNGALRDLCAIKVALYQASLTRLGAQGDAAQDGIYERVLGQIAGPHPLPPPGHADVPLAGEKAPADLGLAAERALVPAAQRTDTVGKENLPAVGKGPWDDGAYAGYVLMRLAFRRCQEETLPAP